MHIHLPKPFHGWRELLGEVGVIVVGILIAIGLEQVVEELHWSTEVRHARTALADDMAESNRAFAYRVATERCIAARVDTLNSVIERVARHLPVATIGQVIPDIGNGLYRAAWDTNQHAQTLTHFDGKELGLYGSYYLQLSNVQAFMAREVDDWGVLKILEGDPSRLGPVDIAGL